MAKYTITYLNHPVAESSEPVLTLVNELPNPLPPASQRWTSYKHDGKTVIEISTSDADAAIVIVPSMGAVLGDQNVKAKLGTTAGGSTSSTWRAAGTGMRLDMTSQTGPATFDLTDARLPPQALRVTVKRPILAPPPP